MEDNGGYGLSVKEGSSIQLIGCRLIRNGLGPLYLYGLGSSIETVSKSNVCDDLGALPLPGFCFDGDENALVSEEETNKSIGRDNIASADDATPEIVSSIVDVVAADVVPDKGSNIAQSEIVLQGDPESL